MSVSERDEKTHLHSNICPVGRRRHCTITFARWWSNFMWKLDQMNKGSASIYWGQRLVLDWSVCRVTNLSNKGSISRCKNVNCTWLMDVTNCGLRFLCENIVGKKLIASWNVHISQAGNSLSCEHIKMATYYIYHMGKMLHSLILTF